MGKTSTEVKQRWENKAYKRIMVRFRVDSADDRLLMQFLEDNKDARGGTTQIFRDALKLYIKERYPHYGE